MASANEYQRRKRRRRIWCQCVSSRKWWQPCEMGEDGCKSLLADAAKGRWTVQWRLSFGFCISFILLQASSQCNNVRRNRCVVRYDFAFFIIRWGRQPEGRICKLLRTCNDQTLQGSFSINRQSIIKNSCGGKHEEQDDLPWPIYLYFPTTTFWVVVLGGS